MRCFTLFVFFYLIGVCSCDADRRNDDEAREFHHDGVLIRPEDVIPANYSFKQSPKDSHENPPNVTISIHVERVSQIDESSMTFTMGCYLIISWVDKRLNFPDGIVNLPLLLPPKWLGELWKPDVVIRNVKEMNFFTMPTDIPYHSLWYRPEGDLSYISRVTFVLHCPMNFRNYPHDKQVCEIRLESFEHTVKEIVLKWDERFALYTEENFQAGLTQLRVTSNSTEDCTYLMESWSKDPYTCLSGKFHFERDLGHILFHIYIPTIIIVMVSWLSFWLSYEDVTERVMLGITSLLTIFAQHSISGELIPPVSYLTAVDIFMLMCTMFVFLSILELSVVYVLACDFIKYREQTDKVADLNNLIKMNKPNNDGKIKKDCLELEPTVVDPSAEHRMHLAMKLDKFSRYAGPASFVILNIIYWTVYELL